MAALTHTTRRKLTICRRERFASDDVALDRFPGSSEEEDEVPHGKGAKLASK